MGDKTIAEEHADFLARNNYDVDPLDAIIMGADEIRNFPGSFASHERLGQPDLLTFALFLAKLQTSDAFEAFYDKGGRFTDQCDAEGRTAEDILQERLSDAKRNTLSAEDIGYIGRTIDTYNTLVERQGELIHVEERIHIVRRSGMITKPYL